MLWKYIQKFILPSQNYRKVRCRGIICRSVNIAQLSKHISKLYPNAKTSRTSWQCRPLDLLLMIVMVYTGGGDSKNWNYQLFRLICIRSSVVSGTQANRSALACVIDCQSYRRTCSYIAPSQCCHIISRTCNRVSYCVCNRPEFCFVFRYCKFNAAQKLSVVAWFFLGGWIFKTM